MPLYQKLNAFSVEDNVSPLAATSREFPCPECSDSVSLDRVAIMRYEGRASVPYYGQPTPPEYHEYVRRDAVFAMLDAVTKAGLVKVETGPTDDMSMTFGVKASVGVVSPTVVATMEQRIAQNQQVVAMEVVDEAKRLISNWNSHYTGDNGSIQKSQAIQEIEEALDVILRKRGEAMRAARDV